jgi:signal transduction histidine kinase
MSIVVPTPEREKTNESLRTEREKADLALLNAREEIEENADEAVNRIRENADAVITVAREITDGQPAAEDSVALEREIEDKLLREERAAIDETLRAEREAIARIMARHLPFERHVTDKDLLIERARADQALSHRDDFLAMACHDLRDLLNGIVVSSALLARKAVGEPDPRHVQAESDRIRRHATRMNRLISDLADVASIDTGKLAVRPLPGDASRLVDEAIEALQGSALAKGVNLEAGEVESPLPANFDHDRLLQVLTNLIVNGIKFTSAGGYVRVDCGKAAGGEVRFCVSDTGQGVPENMLESIFERFWQVGKNDRRGLGLGLYISRCLVEAHGGTIHAESTLGEGSRFIFTLPPGGAPIPKH